MQLGVDLHKAGRKRIWVSVVHGGSSRRFVGLRDEVHGGGGEKRRVVRDPAKVWCPRKRRREVVKNGGGRDEHVSWGKKESLSSVYLIVIFFLNGESVTESEESERARDEMRE
ncbi:hypothetical protein YC2023_017265 [Brassica napus]